MTSKGNKDKLEIKRNDLKESQPRHPHSRSPRKAGPLDPQKRFMSLDEVAELLDVNYQLIYRLVRSGELPSVRIGRVYRIDANDLESFIQSSKTGAPLGSAACSSCGALYQSQTSLSQACIECGAPICTTCWKLEGIRHCRDHAPQNTDKT